MQRLWYYLLRTYVWAGLHFYFKKIIIHGRRGIPSGPVIFAANHQNAFLDALMIVCFNSHFTYFLTRADVFKKPFVRWLLSTLNMLPIYRIRDGWQSLSENQKIFDTCTKLFLKDGAIVIFPEGNHGGQRRLRPLSKGFARLAFESIEKHPSLQISIVPVGLNYSDHHAFRSSVSVYFGEPILANQYIEEPGQLGASLRNELEERLKKLIAHVENADEYESIIQKLDPTHPNYLDPQDTNQRISRIQNGEVLPVPPARNNGVAVLLTPFSILAWVINFIPLMLWRNIRRGVKDPVFVASLKFGVGVFLFPFYYGAVGVLVYALMGSFAAWSWCIVAIPSMLFKK